MAFWLKNILLMAILIAIAAFLLFGDELSFHEFSLGSDKTSTTATDKETDNDAFSLTTSDAALGLSSFYGKIKQDLLGNNDTIGDGFVVRLKPSRYSLDQQLRKRGKTVTPGNPVFTGNVTSRRFRQGKTIKDQLTAAAEAEGMELIWRLERDYVIKHYFQVDSNLLGALGTVASALDSDFEHDVHAFYCYRQRAVIITHEFTDFVKDNCRKATSDS